MIQTYIILIKGGKLNFCMVTLTHKVVIISVNKMLMCARVKHHVLNLFLIMKHNLESRLDLHPFDNRDESVVFIFNM